MIVVEMQAIIPEPNSGMGITDVERITAVREAVKTVRDGLVADGGELFVQEVRIER